MTGAASVIDGDTLEIHGTRIRLFGIDAPESAQLCSRPDGEQWQCGQRAALALALSDVIGRSVVSCEAKDKDRYARLVAVCRKGGKDLSGWMVSEGWAVAYRQYSSDYVSQEGSARAASKHIWAGAFAMPWDWRHGKKAAQARRAPTTAASPACNIKGNISSRGELIYHVPGGQYYEPTIINLHKGERWFCTEPEARAAGWRPSRR